jgi:hypothetical protein
MRQGNFRLRVPDRRKEDRNGFNNRGAQITIILGYVGVRRDRP